MPRTCATCSHHQRAAIDAALVEGTESLRNIAKQFSVSVASLNRHRAHVPAHVAKAHEAAQVADADGLLAQLKGLRTKAVSILEAAEKTGDYRTALMGIREARSCIETLMEIEGELDRRIVTNITVNPAWVEIRTVLVTALEPYPDAAQAVAAALVAIDEGSTS